MIMLVLILVRRHWRVGMARRRSAACSSDSAVAGLAAVGTLMDEDEDAEEKLRRMEAKIAAENFGAANWLRRGRGPRGERKLDEHAAQEKQRKQQHEQTMGGL